MKQSTLDKTVDAMNARRQPQPGEKRPTTQEIPVLSREEYTEWLKSKDPRDVIGDSRNFWWCLMPTYLKDKFQENVDIHRVCELKFAICMGDKTSRMPRWAIWLESRAFRLQTDGTPFKSNYVGRREITAAWALEILEGIK